jgi:hypothetical protein
MIMSSIYRLLCLSHDPAIEIDTEHEWHSGNEGRKRVEEAAIEGNEWHPNCDLLIGRYSYPLVEIGCPSSSHSTPFQHNGTKWIDATWAALVIIASESNLILPHTIVNSCWKPDRVKKLKIHLEHYINREVKIDNAR